MRVALISLCILLIGKPSSNHFISEAVDIIVVIKDVTTYIMKAWDLVEKVPLGTDIEIPILQDKQRKVVQRINEVNLRINEVEQFQLQLTALTIENLTRVFKEESALSDRMAKVKSLTNKIKERKHQLENYQTGPFEQLTLRKFAEWNVDPGSDNIHSILQTLFEELFGIDDNTFDENSVKNCLLIHLTKQYESSPDQMCELQQTSQQYVHSLIVKAILTELKGYTISEFSFMMLRQLGLGNFSQEISLMRKNHEKRLNLAQIAANQIMMNSSRDYWRCDPDGSKDERYVLGKTYEQITRLLQGYVENEVNLNQNQECWSTCGEYSNTHVEQCYKPIDEYCGKQDKCKGNLYNCRYIESDMWVCPATQNSTIRYDFIEFESGSILGKIFSWSSYEDKCKSKIVKVESWWRYIFWHCSYCLCLCDEQGPLSDRFFNLRDTITDFKKNRVATGVRFVKNQRVFHLQLQQGELLPNGAINNSSLEWIPIDSYAPDQVDVRNGYDYHTLSYDSRSLDLDEIVTESNSHVVTGVRFRLLGKHLNLEVRFSEYNYTSGRLNNPETNSFWLSNDNTDVSGQKIRQKLILNNPDLPINSELKSLPLSKHNQFMEFTSSDARADAAQNTVPFIDMQDVVPKPVVPLAGLGLYHKGRKGFGGFFAPKVITYDISKNFSLN